MDVDLGRKSQDYENLTLSGTRQSAGISLLNQELRSGRGFKGRRSTTD